MTLPAIDNRNADQAEYWNGQGGQHWTQQQKVQDLVLEPVLDILIERAKIKPGERVLDIGCGCGASTFVLAQKTGSSGHVTGLDISEPMLGRARELTPQGAPIDFVLADATVYDFKPASVDMLFSRFGVMFFADPTASFKNMRKALRPNGRMIFACWRTPRENPMLIMPLQEAYKHVPKLPEVKPEDPGPFAFADDQRLKSILSAAGFASVEIDRADLKFDIATGKGLDAALETATSIGPASRAIAGQPPALAKAAVESIRSALAKHQSGNRVLLDGSIWIVTAANGS
ncbi:MAG: methyltransferase domain-containing protein [Afipia sp.]|nr:methyltransferase domain-containing protein [Afipia sp.]